MRDVLRNLAALLTIATVLGICFLDLCRHPGSILVDPDRPSVDHAIRGKTRGAGNDLTDYYLPRLLWTQRAIETSGRPSFWDSSGFGGRPLVGNPQAGLFYPWAWPVMAFGGVSSLGWLTVGHLLMGAFGVFALARCYAFSKFASMVASVCYVIGPYMLGHVFEGHYPHVWSACWYPWAFLCWKKGVGGSRLAFVGLPMFLVFCLLTGHSQEWYYLVILISLFAWIDGFGGKGANRVKTFLKVNGCWLATLGLTLGICAVEIIPDLLAQKWALKSSTIQVQQILLYNLQFDNLLQWLHPFALGTPDRYFGHGNSWETQLAIGFLPILLAFVGYRSARKHAELRRWPLFVLGCWIFAAGPKLGLFQVFYQLLPGMDRFRVASRTLFMANLGTSLLVAAGLDALSSSAWGGPNGDRFRRRLLGFVIVLIAVGIVSLGITFLDDGSLLKTTVLIKSKRRLFFAVLAIAEQPSYWFALISATVVIAIPRSWGISAKKLSLTIGILAVVELVWLSHETLHIADPGRFLGRDQVTSLLPNEAFAPSRPYRLASRESTLSDVRAARFGMEKTNINDSYQIQAAADLYECLYPFLEPRRPPGWGTHPMDHEVTLYKTRLAQAVLDLLSVKWVVTEAPVGFERLEVVANKKTESAEFAIAVNRDPLPRSYVVPECRRIDSADQSLNWLLDVSPRMFVMLEVADPLPKARRQPFLPASYRSIDSDHVDIDVDTVAPGFLVVTNTWDPGWTAWVDGRPVKILRGNRAQQVIPIERAGRHHVELRFEPVGLRLGLVVSGVSIVVWLVALLMVGYRWRKPPQTQP